VRDPIAHNISRFFLFAPSYTDVARDEWPRNADQLEQVDELARAFLENYPHDRVLQWFEKWKDNIGIDVFDHPFPTSGVGKIQAENITITILRTELPDEKKAEALRAPLGLDEEFEITRSNVGTKKPYAETYNRFKQEFTPPDWYVSKMYDSRFFQHFYTPDYRRRFERRWTGTRRDV